MSVAIPTVTRLQDQHDVFVGVGADVDGYALTYDSASSKFILASSLDSQITKRRIRAERVYNGVGHGTAALAIRCDDGSASDYTTIFPLLQNRYLPAGFAVITDRINTGGGMTTAQLLTMQKYGMEIMNQSATHGTDPVSISQFTTEAISNLTTLNTLGLNCESFVAPGTWVGDYLWTTPKHLESIPCQMLAASYAAWEGYLGNLDLGGHWNVLPSGHKYGSKHYSGLASLATMEAWVDGLIAAGGSATLCYDTFALGGVGQMTVADFATLLTYIQGKRDTGMLTVLTPTSLQMANRIIPINFLSDPGFELSGVNGALHPQSWTSQGAGAKTLVNSGAHGGIWAIQCAKNGGLQQLISAPFRSGVLSFWAKSATHDVSSNVRVDLRDQTNPTRLEIDTNFTVGNDWTLCKIQFGTHYLTSELLVWIWGNSEAADVVIDDISLIKL